jgi:uncharacterized lipoprotein YajG
MKITKWASALSLVVAVAIQGCALKPQNLHLDPEIDVTGDSVAVDTLIALSIRDGRSSKVLGEVGDPNDPNQEMVDVTLDEDFIPLLTDKVSAALEKRGFSVVPASEALTRSLIIEIGSLDLNSEKTPFNFQTELRAEVVATGQNTTEQYERRYYVRSYQETAGPPFEKHSNQLVNDAVSNALSDMLNDDKLFEMLAR